MGRVRDEDLEPEVEFFYYYIECFFELGTCRSGDGPIPFTAIYEYSKIYNEYEFDEFLYIIRLLDDVYLQHRVRKENKDANSNKNNSSSR